jgi:hypothetical protein
LSLVINRFGRLEREGKGLSGFTKRQKAAKARCERDALSATSPTPRSDNDETALKVVFDVGCDRVASLEILAGVSCSRLINA